MSRYMMHSVGLAPVGKAMLSTEMKDMVVLVGLTISGRISEWHYSPRDSRVASKWLVVVE